MGFEWIRPWYLLTLPVALLAVLLADRKYARQGLKNAVTRGLRMLLFCTLSLALSGTTILGQARSMAVWIVADASASARGSQAAMEQAINAALSELPENARAGVISFGENAMVEAALSAQPGYTGRHALIDEQGSNLSDALRLAGALLPADAVGQLVVLTDGKTDVPDLTALANRGVLVNARIFETAAQPDVQAMSVSVPSTAYEGQSFSVTVSVQSNMETRGTLVLYANRQIAATQEVFIRKGESAFAFTDAARVPGVVTYEAQVVAEGDLVSQNNRCGAYMVVSGQPSILLVEGRVGEGDALAAMLKAAGLDCERLTPERVEARAEGLRKYDAILLANVDADALSAAQTAALDEAVRTLGRGLCVFGGDSSYALGGYRGSALEKMLPVTIDVKSKLDMPSLALMLAIDKSGSMTAAQFGTTRLDLAKEGALRATEVLTANDFVGVIAFDDAAKWVVDLQKVEDLAAIQDAIGTIRPGGGTAYYAALYNAYQALAASDAQQRHVIFLTDGEPGDGGYDAIVAAMAEAGITLTTVAVGSGANAVELKRLADMGKGRVYVTDEFDNIPKIFAKETYLVSGSYVQNRLFTPAIAEEGMLTDYAGFPQLTGYLATTEKSLATVSLVSDRDEPVLAWWRYGAGKVLAWTSDTKGGWTRNWQGWDDCAAFFANMASFVLPQREQAGELSVTGERIEYQAAEGARATDYVAQVLSPDGLVADIALPEIAPGLYAAPWQAGAQGAYATSVQADGATVLEGGYVENYSAEYDLDAIGRAAELSAAILRAGGAVLTEADALIQSAHSSARVRRDITRQLLLLSLILFVLDVALRRLAWERAVESWLRRPKREKAAPRPKAPAPPKKKAAQPAAPKPAEAAGKLLDAMREKKKL